MENKVILGEMYRDSVTGFEGAATIRAEYVTGKPRVTLERIGDAIEKSFDEARLEPATKPA